MMLLTGTILSLCTLTFAASASDWRSRSIYQVLTDRFARTDGSTTATCNTADRVYCGGTYQGLINHLDYIQGAGFTAVWISPVTLQLEGTTAYGQAYHGYWQTDLYSLNSNFGTADDLKSLASALHDRDMYLMVDIVVNHNGWAGDADSVDYSTFNPFDDESYYHSYCTIDYDSTTSIQDCWLGDSNVELPDLATEDSDVASGYQTWISQLVSEYSIDGLRIDTARHVDTDFWSGFESAAGVFVTGEFYDGDVSVVCGGQDHMDSVLNYPMYYALTAAFASTSGDMSGLASTIESVKSTCDDVTLLGTFSENHDQPRFASLTGDISLAKNIIAGTIMSDGIPIIYEGQEQHYNAQGGSNDPYNREAIWFSGYNTDATLYEVVAKLNSLRSTAISGDSGYLSFNSYVIYGDTTTAVLRKGSDDKQVITVLTNKGADGDTYTMNLSNTGWGSGFEATDILTCDTTTVASDGTLPVPMESGLPRVYYPTALAGTFC